MIWSPTVHFYCMWLQIQPKMSLTLKALSANTPCVDFCHTFSLPSSPRTFPLDMAGFAISLRLIIENPKVEIGLDSMGKTSRQGYLETDFLENFATRQTTECRGSKTEVQHVVNVIG